MEQIFESLCSISHRMTIQLKHSLVYKKKRLLSALFPFQKMETNATNTMDCFENKVVAKQEPDFSKRSDQFKIYLRVFPFIGKEIEYIQSISEKIIHIKIL